MHASYSASSSNIQDQCLIITDIYGVQEKGVVAENTILFPNTIKQKGLPEPVATIKHKMYEKTHLLLWILTVYTLVDMDCDDICDPK